MLIRLLLLLAVVFWGWSFVATKVALDYVSPAELIGLRYILGLPVIAVLMIGRGELLRFSAREWTRLAIASAVITSHFYIQVVGINYTSATNTGWIISVTPLALAILSYLFLKERLGMRQVGGIAIATLGILLLVSRGSFANVDWLSSIGDWLVLASAHTWAIYTIVTRDLSRQHPPIVVTFWILLMSSVIFIVWMLFTSDWGQIMAMPTEAKTAVAFLGVFCLGVAFWFWQEAVSRMGAARAGFYLYFEPIATTALAVPYLGEPFGPWGIAGAVAVLLGVLLAEKRVRPPIQ